MILMIINIGIMNIIIAVIIAIIIAIIIDT
jgi:hypothetical protein